MPLIRVGPALEPAAAPAAEDAGLLSDCQPAGLRRVGNKRSRHRLQRTESEIGRGGPPRLAPSELTPALVQTAISPHLTEERRSRIERVLRQRLASVTVVLENLYDPQNGAAVLRTCEAMGLIQVHAIEGDTAYYFSRKVSRGTHKWLNVYLHRSTRSCLAHLRRCGFVCWAAVPPERLAPALATATATATATARMQPLVDASRPVALVFGNEHAGLSAEARAACDRPLQIPMQGFCESFNLSVSVALALYQATSLRREHLGRSGDLQGELLSRLRAAYYANSTPHAAALVLEWLQRQSSTMKEPVI